MIAIEEADPNEVPEKDRRSGKKQFHWTPRVIAIVVTLALHLFAGIGMLFQVVRTKKEKKPEIVAQIIGPVEEEQKKSEKKSVKKQAQQVSASAPPMTKLLRSNSIAMTAVPQMTELTTGPIGLGQGNLSLAGFGSTKSKSLGSGAMFFGSKVSGKLGVVFDVSGSMHPYVPVVCSEIKQKFRDSLVVCVNSSEFSHAQGKPTAVKYKDASESTVNMPYLMSDNAKKMHEDLLRLPNCWFSVHDQDTLGHGVEFLMDRGINTVFVFSDFQDLYHGYYIENLTARAQADGVKVNLQVLQDFPSYNRGRVPFLEALAKKSGGRYAVGELLDRVR